MCPYPINCKSSIEESPFENPNKNTTEPIDENTIFNYCSNKTIPNSTYNKRQTILSQMWGLDYLDPEVCKFAEFYMDFKESRNEEPSGVEGDEALIQLAMLETNGVTGLIQLIEKNWNRKHGKHSSTTNTPWYEME